MTAYRDPDELADIARDEARAIAEADFADGLTTASTVTTQAIERLQRVAGVLRGLETMGLAPEREEGNLARLGEFADTLATAVIHLLEDIDAARRGDWL